MFQLLKVMDVQRWLPCIICFCWCSNDSGKILKHLQRCWEREGERKVLVFFIIFSAFIPQAMLELGTHLIREGKEFCDIRERAAHASLSSIFIRVSYLFLGFIHLLLFSLNPERSPWVCVFVFLYLILFDFPWPLIVLTTIILSGLGSK